MLTPIRRARSAALALLPVVSPAAVALGLTSAALALALSSAAPARAQDAPAQAQYTSVSISPPSLELALDTLAAESALLAADQSDSALLAADQSAPAQASPAKVRLPACEYQDILTRYRKVRDWQKTLLDTNLKVKRTYRPGDLVPVSRAGLRGVGSVRRVMLDDLAALGSGARRKGKPLAVRSAYRSYQTQAATFDSWVARTGYQEALRFSARPGHSEHQLGTTVDFTTAPGVPLSTSFGESPAGKWLARNGWKYGFIMSYPKGKQKVSCYGYEPWHWRYLGRELAARIHESGQVPRRYLYENFEIAP